MTLTTTVDLSVLYTVLNLYNFFGIKCSYFICLKLFFILLNKLLSAQFFIVMKILLKISHLSVTVCEFENFFTFEQMYAFCSVRNPLLIPPKFIFNRRLLFRKTEAPYFISVLIGNAIYMSTMKRWTKHNIFIVLMPNPIFPCTPIFLHIRNNNNHVTQKLWHCMHCSGLFLNSAYIWCNKILLNLHL